MVNDIACSAEGQGNVYERAERILRERLGQRRNRESCVALGLWLLRQHGPYAGRVFAVPRIELAQDERFMRQVGLTSSQIRTATEALIEAGMLNRLSEPRSERRKKDPPTQFEIGTEFALLFPNAARSAPLSLLATSSKTPKIQNMALFVATWKNPLPRPVRQVAPKTEKDLWRARLEALKAQPLPKLSPGALRSFIGRAGQGTSRRSVSA